MKIRIKILFYFLLALIIFGIFIFFLIQNIKPSIVLQNNTAEKIYIYAGSSSYQEEPTIEEVEQMMTPYILESGQAYTLSSPFQLSKTKELSAGWKIGKQTNQVISSIGAIEEDKGTCIINININDNGFDTTQRDQLFCYKKLKQIR